MGTHTISLLAYANILAAVDKYEKENSLYMNCYQRCIIILEAWIQADRPTNYEDLAEAVKVDRATLQAVCGKYPQLRKLIVNCQRIFGLQWYSVMALEATAARHRRRWAKDPQPS